MSNTSCEHRDLERHIAVFGALSSRPRALILHALADHRLCVGALARRLGITQSAVSQHLRILRAAGLVQGSRDGSRVHYEIVPEALEQCAVAIAQLVHTATSDEEGPDRARDAGTPEANRPKERSGGVHGGADLEVSRG